MALLGTNAPFVGSGEFVQEREWTCSKHDSPQYHECDCGHCSRQWDCRGCAKARWLDLTNPDGSPLMRELSVSEHYWRRQFVQIIEQEVEASRRFLGLLDRDRRGEPITIVWDEDDADLPRPEAAN